MGMVISHDSVIVLVCAFDAAFEAIVGTVVASVEGFQEFDDREFVLLSDESAGAIRPPTVRIPSLPPAC